MSSTRRSWMAGIAAVVGLMTASAVAAQTSPSPALIPAEDVRADLDALYAELEQAHYDLFIHRSRADYDRLHAALKHEIAGPMTRDQAAILLQRFTAYGRIGHARIDAPNAAFRAHTQGGGRILPLFIRVDGDRAFLMETADAEGRFRAGTEILTLDGEPVGAWLERLGGYISAERPYMINALMEYDFPAALWFDRPDADGIEISGRAVDGRPISGRVPAVTLAEHRAHDAAWPTPTLTTDFSTREFRMLENGIAYLRPGPFYDMDAVVEGPGLSFANRKFVAFIDDAFSQILAAGATDLIIDMRNNPGGDNSFSDPMIAWFADRPFRFASRFTLRASPQAKAWYRRTVETNGPAEGVLADLIAAEAAQPDGARYTFELEMKTPRAEPRFHGRVHVLVNRHSYSNATSAAALIQDYGFGEILGEETADVPTTYGSIIYFDLPRTGFTVTFPKSQIVRPNGDETVIGVVPDRVLPREPIGEAADVVLNHAIAVVREGRNRPGAD